MALSQEVVNAVKAKYNAADDAGKVVIKDAFTKFLEKERGIRDQKIANQRVDETPSSVPAPKFPKNTPLGNKMVGTYNGKPVYENSKGQQYFFTGRGGTGFVPKGKLESATPETTPPPIVTEEKEGSSQGVGVDTGAINYPPIPNVGTGQIPYDQSPKISPWMQGVVDKFTPQKQGTGTVVPPGYVSNDARRTNALGHLNTYSKTKKPNDYQTFALNTF